MSAPPERITAHAGDVGGLAIRRALPSRSRRTVGPWCFLDHLGPAMLGNGLDLRVAPHPHIGLQTFSWMISGEILHRDSLGTEQVIRPGQVNLMTAGRGIAHSEEALPGTGRLHMTQLWIALPDAHRHTEPAFSHHPVLPKYERNGIAVTVLAGTHEGETAPGRFYSPLVGLDVRGPAGRTTALSLDPAFEHAVLVLEGQATLAGERAEPGEVLYFAPSRGSLPVAFDAGGHFLLIGGSPFEEAVLMWWNFVGRHPAELRQAAEDWNAGRGTFGRVVGYDGEPLVAPDPSAIHLSA